MTFSELVERAKRQLNAGQPQPHVWPDSEIDIAACVRQASSQLAHKVMRDESLRALLQQEYEVTLDGAGEGDLLAATGSITSVAGEILLEGIQHGIVLDADTNPLQYIQNYADFLKPQPTVYGYYHLKDKATILTCAINTPVDDLGDIVSAPSPLTITASYTPADVDDFPPELEDPLVQELVSVIAVKLKPANADS
jgi:hypothetical protein